MISLLRDLIAKQGLRTLSPSILSMTCKKCNVLLYLNNPIASQARADEFLSRRDFHLCWLHMISTERIVSLSLQLPGLLTIDKPMK